MTTITFRTCELCRETISSYASKCSCEAYQCLVAGWDDEAITVWARSAEDAAVKAVEDRDDEHVALDRSLAVTVQLRTATWTFTVSAEADILYSADDMTDYEKGETDAQERTTPHAEPDRPPAQDLG